MQVELLPQQFDFVYDDDSARVLITGGRGSSKSTGLDWKTYRRARYKGACEFLGRQRLIDLRTTTLRLLLEGAGSMPPIIPPGSYHHDKTEKIIRIHGGGQIVYNGMDQGDVGRQIGSTGRGSSMNLSGANIDEAVEVSEANLIQIAGAIRVKVPGIPLQMNLACNPSVPAHHIARDFGLAQGHIAKPGFRVIHCNPADNYFLPPEFIASLETLEGVARERYLYGNWVGSDGLVYDKWDRNIHVLSKPGPAKRVVLGVDEGYTDPFVALLLHIDSDGRVHVAAEVYESRLTQDEKIDRVRSLADGSPEVFVDSAAPDLIESMRRKNINARPADKGPGSVNFGIGLIQQRLVVQGDGLPRLTVDPSCVNTIREFESYEWKPGGERLKDEPIDRDNHACFVAGTMVETDRGPRPIESIRVGDRVATPNGYEPVTDCGMTHDDAMVYRLLTCDGPTLIGTGNHPVWVVGKGMVRLDSLRYEDIILSWNPCTKMDTNTRPIAAVTTVEDRARSQTTQGCTASSMNSTTGRSRTAGMFTTKTVTSPTTPSKIWKHFLQAITFACTTRTISRPPVRQPENGTGLRRAGNGTRLMPRNTWPVESTSACACSANDPLCSRDALPAPSSAQTSVNLPSEGGRAWTRNPECASGVVGCSRPTSMPVPNTAPAVVLAVEPAGRATVYNLTVGTTHAYFAGGFLVSNCDALRYACRSLDAGKVCYAFAPPPKARNERSTLMGGIR